MIDLDKIFTPRNYQIPFLSEMFVNRKKKRFLLCWPRRAGKDLVCFYAAILKMIEKPTQVYFIYPTYSQGKKILFEGLDNEGRPLIDYLPKEWVVSKNSQEMTIKLKNGSLFKIVGSDEPDRLVGTNAGFMVFSEYALANPQSWAYLRQVVRANQGTAVFISTPRGRNHFFDLYNYALEDPEGEWFVSKLTVDDTKHVSKEDLEKEALSTSEDMMQQEWYTSFSLGVEGSYYSKYLNQIRLNSQIGNVPWNPKYKVHCALDIGYGDSCAIVWFQVINQCINILDYYENNKHGLAHYAKIILEKPYVYGKVLFPHDGDNHEFGTGLTIKEQAHSMGLNVSIVPKLSIEAGIEAVRVTLSRCYFDEVKCSKLLKMLESYRQLFDAKRQVYLGKPLHDFASHGADAFRYMAVSIPMIVEDFSAQDLDNIYQQTRMGSSEAVPKPFQQPNYY